jgi:hypothetical protein
MRPQFELMKQSMTSEKSDKIKKEEKNEPYVTY